MLSRLLLTTILLTLCRFASAQYPSYISSYPIAGPNTDNGNFIDVDAAGNVYVAGIFGMGCDFDPSGSQSLLNPVGSTDIFIAKYSPSGSLIWKYTIGGNTELLLGMRVDDAGNAYIIGNYYSSVTAFGLGSNNSVFANGAADAFIVKYNSGGQLRFIKSIGGNATDSFDDLEVDNNTGDIYLGGYFNSSQMDFDPGAGQVVLLNTTPVGVNANPFIAKYDSSGNYIWAFNFKNMGSGHISALSLDASGRLVAGGYFTGTMVVDSVNTTINASAGGIDNVIMRFSSAGTYDNGWTFGGISSDYLTNLVTTGNDIVATGVFLDSMDVNPGNGVSTVYSSGSNEIYLTKIDENGVFQWGGSIKGSLNDYVLGITANSAGEVYITGYFNFAASFDLTSNSGVQTAYSGKDGFVAKYSSSGALITAMAIGSDGNDQVDAIVHTGNGEFLITGSFVDNPLHVDPFHTSTLLPNAGGSDVFVARYSDILTVGLTSVNSDNVKIYPVPAADFINIELKNTGNYTARLLDVSGRIASGNVVTFDNHATLNTAAIESGIYLIEVKNGNDKPVYYRFIKQ